MMNSSITIGVRILSIGVLAIAFTGCGKSSSGATAQPVASLPPVAAPTASTEAVRGAFGDGSCESNQRVPVPANAAFAMYFDNDGNEIASAPVEVLAGTERNQMCPAAAQENEAEPGFCTPLCTKKIGGRNVCIKCS
jgi:hypothetical protein